MYENVHGLKNWNDVVFVKNVCVSKSNDLWFLHGLGGGVVVLPGIGLICQFV